VARPLRIEFEDAFYHVTSRGNEQKNIFKSDRDRDKFLAYLESATERYAAVVHAYCLMDNHYHLFLQTPAGNLSQIMQHINGAYTTYYNVKRKRSGHLFQGRYKALLVDADAHAQELSRYIHLNPVRAGVVEKPEHYRWSSYNPYIKESRQQEWLHTDFILGLFTGKKESARKQYRRFVESMLGKQQESPLQNIFASTILGDVSFINRIREKHVIRTVTDRNLPAVKHFHEKPGIEEIIRQVEKSLPTDAALAKRVQLYICHKYSGQKLKDIGLCFGVSESGISQASRRVADKIGQDRKLKKLINGILSDFNLSRV
jgi:REP element-mobilizing transposase RayT